jgi:hypothetical protein
MKTRYCVFFCGCAGRREGEGFSDGVDGRIVVFLGGFSIFFEGLEFAEKKQMRTKTNVGQFALIRLPSVKGVKAWLGRIRVLMMVEEKRKGTK